MNPANPVVFDTLRSVKGYIARFAVAVAIFALVLGLMGIIDALLFPPAAQLPAHPFGVGLREAAPGGTGLGAAILAVQSQFHLRMVAALRAVSSSDGAFWMLLAMGFAYGVFHAAGPGHGKAVISGYLMADGRRTLRRGLGLAFLSSMLQGVVAIVIVTVLALALQASATTINAGARWLELGSFALVALLGGAMLWRTSGQLLASYENRKALAFTPVAASSGIGDAGDAFARDPFARDPFANVTFQAAGSHAQARQDRNEAALAENATRKNHLWHWPGSNCTCHMPLPDADGREHDWRETVMLVLATGLRPCSGAIILLVFALSQGQFAAGAMAVGAMSFGVFLTVGFLASMAVFARGFASRLLARWDDTGNGRLLAALGGAIVSAAIIAIGLGLVTGAAGAG